MQTAQSRIGKYQPRKAGIRITQIEADSPRRGEVEAFIRLVFARHYGASVASFAPQLLILEQDGSIVAAAGWRDAGTGPLFLERYLDQPIETVMTQLIGRPVQREHIVEVGNLAADRSGSSRYIFTDLAARLDQRGHEWVVFTATRELIGIFARLGLPLLVLGKADPARLGADATAWGRYYETEPIVVVGRVRHGLDRLERMAPPA
jgi:hypothetical protein